MEQLSIFIVMLAALLVPLVMARFEVSTLPTAVAEILIGIVIGKSGFNLIVMNHDLTFLSNLGVILLIFLSGMEINFDLFRKQPGEKRDSDSPVTISTIAFAGILVMSLLVGVVLKLMGLFNGILLALIIFSSVALGVVIATLKEKEILSRPVGQTLLLTAVFGEVVPMLSLTVYATLHGGNAGRLWLIVLLFLAAIILLRRFKQPYKWLNDITKSTTQLDVRLAFFLIFTLVTIAVTVGAENILGAFLAGMVMKLLNPSESTEDKLTSIGYGFFIPIFFITTGAKLNLRELFANPRALALIPALVVGFFIAKTVPALVFSRHYGRRNGLAGAFLCATTITLVLPTLEVARNLKAITSTQSDAFVLAALIACVCGPIGFNKLYQPSPEDLIKKRVVFIGANVMTVPIAQQLTNSLYQVRMVTNQQENFETYNSEVADLKYFENLNAQCLEKSGYFDCDIMVVSFLNEQENFALALEAKKQGVQRVIAMRKRNGSDYAQLDQLVAAGVELFHPYTALSSMLRSLIESPTVMKMMTDNQHTIFEVVLKNRRYTGIELQSLPMINKITVSRIYRQGKWITPHGTTVLEAGDHLIITSDYHNIAELQATLGKDN